MPVVRKKVPVKKANRRVVPSATAAVPEEELLSFIERSMRTYGVEVNLERAVPDFRDGLKPVARRILWATHSLHSPSVKAARVVGETMGSYHPHGDCLSGNTLVYTLDGQLTPIRDMIGRGKKWVLAFDPDRGLVPAIAHSWRVGQVAKTVYDVHFSDGTKITATENHPFYVKTGSKKSWVKAKDLHYGLEIVSAHLTNSDYFSVQNRYGKEPVHAVVSRFANGDSEENEVIHHVNENKKDNRPRNLSVLMRDEHASVHPENYCEGLKAGRETMFSGKNKAYRRAIRKKNSQLMKSHNSWLWLIKAIKVARSVAAAGKPLNKETYSFFAKQSGIYNVTKPETLSKKNVSWGTLEGYIDTWSMPTEKATGLTQDLREYAYQDRMNSQSEKNNDAFHLGLKLSKFMRVVLKTASLGVEEITWSEYEKTRKALVARDHLKHGRRSVSARTYTLPTAETMQKLGSVGELFKQSGSKHGVFVKKVVVRKVTETPMYDFTVDGLQNMMVVSGACDGGHTLVCAHNSSIMGALVNMVTAPTNTMKGVGNWGTLVDPAAAMRYPNCGLSTYGKMFFGKNYTPIINKVPTYDRSGLEPLVLPSLLPNLLFNGTSGIGVGMVTEIPAFTPVSVLKLMIRILNGEEPTSLDFMKTLEFFYQYGGVATKTKLNRAAIKKFLEGTKGTVEWESPLEVNPTRKEITLWKFAPEVQPVKLIEGVKNKQGKKIKPGIKDWDSVAKVTSGKGLSYVIKARRDLNMGEFEALVDRVRKLTTTKISYEVYVTERLPDPDAGEGRYKVNFITCSIPELFQRWLKWRCRLEVASLDWQIAQLQKAIEFLELLIYASSNLDVIFKALRSVDAAAHMVTGLKITLEQANQILDLQVRRLSKLDQTKLKEQLTSTKAKLVELKVKRKDPPGQVRVFLESCLEVFKPHTQFAGTHQFDMRLPAKSAATSDEEG